MQSDTQFVFVCLGIDGLAGFRICLDSHGAIAQDSVFLFCCVPVLF